MHIDYFKFYQLPISKIDKLLMIREKIDEKKQNEMGAIAVMGGIKT